ncbi:Uncharacterised protein [uncultured archaeon]|nr:Uncharacterised protein [uncultured archaeon]
MRSDIAGNHAIRDGTTMRNESAAIQGSQLSDDKTKTGKAKKAAPPAVQKDSVAEKPKEIAEKAREEPKSNENPLLAELEESLAQGLINKETYENTKKLLMME